MTDGLVVLCPSRGRPGAALEVQKVFDETKTLPSTELIFVVDEDDPTLPQYESDSMHLLMVRRSEGGNMVKALNVAAMAVLGDDAGFDPRALGFIGDDHRFRTKGWDEKMLAELARIRGGWVFANDMGQQWRIPTQVIVSADIVRTLGWMSPPVLTHLYVDQAWLLLGNALGYEKISYLPSVVIEHMHPAYGKATWDEGHVRVNSAEMYSKDRLAYEEWVQTSFLDDLAKLRAAG